MGLDSSCGGKDVGMGTKGLWIPAAARMTGGGVGVGLDSSCGGKDVGMGTKGLWIPAAARMTGGLVGVWIPAAARMTGGINDIGKALWRRITF